MMIDNFDSINLKNSNNFSDKTKDSVNLSKFNLNIKSLEIGYEKTLIHNINIDLHEGEFCLISGKSGVGKSALLSTLLGIIKKKRKC